MKLSTYTKNWGILYALEPLGAPNLENETDMKKTDYFNRAN